MAVAAPLPDGDVLIAGGQSANNVLLRSAELFDPTTNTFTKLPASGDTELTVAREHPGRHAIGHADRGDSLAWVAIVHNLQ